MKNFAKYAQFYDLLYNDKNYRGEVDYVDRLIRQYSAKRGKTLLDIGCGTGNHDIWFAKKGYRVTGIDRSREMIAIARDKASVKNNLRFYMRDASKFILRRKFDVAVSLFHVMSYMTANRTIIKSLENIRRHLNKSGLFIFDFWHGPAVLTKRPALKTKIVKDGERLIRRTAVPNMDVNMHTVDVRYEINAKSKKGCLGKGINERHVMRYFFLPELYSMLETAGFEVMKCLKWMSSNKPPDSNCWSGVIIARKG